MKKTISWYLLFLCLTSFWVPSHAGLFSDPFGWLGDVTDDILGPSMDHAKKAVKEVINDLFDKKIGPLVEKINSLFQNDIDKINQDVNALEEKMENFIRATIKDIADKAKQFVDESVEEIKTKIIDRAFDRFDQLEAKTMSDINAILNRVDKMIDNIDCTVMSTERRFEETLNKLIYEPIPNPFETCRGELANEYGFWFRFTPIASMNTIERYQLGKCRIMQHVQNPETPIEYVCHALLSVEELAMYGRCGAVAISAPDVIIYFLKERMKVTEQLETFNCASRSKMARSNEAVVVAAAGDTGCGTPVECYAAAVKALNEARKELNQFEENSRSKFDKLAESLITLNKKLDVLTATFNNTIAQIATQVVQMKASILGEMDAKLNTINQRLQNVEDVARKGHCINVKGNCSPPYSGVGPAWHANNGWFNMCCIS